MTNKNTHPSIDPVDESSLEGVFKHVLNKHMQKHENRMRAKIVAYDRKTNMATVQPLVNQVGTDGQVVQRAQLVNIPIQRSGGGGAIMSFPIKEGDVGFIQASDRDESLVAQNGYDHQIPNTARTHSFSNGSFMPDSMKQWDIAEEDMDKVVIGNTDGSVKITFDGDTLKIVATVKTIVDAPDAEFTGNVLIKGNATIEGTLNAQGGVTGAGGTTLEGHIHKDVTPGAGLTGIPKEGT